MEVMDITKDPGRKQSSLANSESKGLIGNIGMGKKEKLVEESREARMNEQSDYGDTRNSQDSLHPMHSLHP